LRDVDEALASSSLPRGARRAIVRGLSPRPDERFESMPALLQALAARPRSRARLALALGLGLAGGGALTWSVSRSSTPADRCAEGRAALESTWNEERAAGLRESLTHTAVAHAEQTSQRVLERLDAHAQQWSEAHASLCARAPGDPEVEGRLRCLDDRLIELDALGSALAEPDGASVDLASQAVAGLRSPRACTGDEWTPLPANLEPPPSIATQVDALRPRLELGSAYEVTGQFERALAVLAEVSREAESLGYAPMVAQAGYLRGLVLVEQGRYDEAKQALERAFMTAFGVADDATMVQSAALLASTMSSRHADLPRAELWNELARSAAERYGLDSEQGASYWQSSGILAFRRGEYDRSREALERALALYRAHLPADHPTIPAVLSLLAALEATERRYVEAEAKAREVLALRTALLGDRHPDLITDEVTLASALTPQGKPDEAIEHLERALALGMASLDPEHPRRLGVQNNLATALNRKGEHERARELYAEILRVRLRDLGREDPATALAHHNLASTLYHVGAREEALEHHREAVAIFEAVYGRDHERVALALNSQATTLEALGRCDEAEQTVARAWTIIGEAAADEAGERHPLAAFVADTRASIALCRGDEETALASARLAVEIAEATPGEPRATLPRFLVTLAQARLRAGETQEADDAARRAIDLLGPASPVSRVRAELVLAAVARARGDEAELRSHLERAKAHLPADGPRRESLARQIDELGAEGRDLEPR
ncbi:MAG: tetratricopeptide repeat protein, partial [Myxococcales bacterium]|nr:tetratricopeptide repeat protein [Myxococcales bacterium]